jgi:hypothetical protein
MASLTVTNSALEIAFEREDGYLWYAALEYEDGTVVLADSLTDLVATLIDDYDPENTIRGAVDAYLERCEFAVQVAGARQALQAFAANQEGLFDHEVESEEVLTTIFSEKDVFIPEIEMWNHQVPLVLIATDYFPTTAISQPTGNIQWVNPSTELTLLTSLTELGDFRLHIQAGE